MAGSEERQDGKGKRSTRDVRLAEKLRQNLGRRKAKARAARTSARQDVAGDEQDATRPGASVPISNERET